jgi:hypothetical protein
LFLKIQEKSKFTKKKVEGPILSPDNILPINIGPKLKTKGGPF